MTQTSKHPNIVYFLTDDLGYGDVSCLNSEGKIPTPHFDQLAREGMTCTDAHSTSALCSPSRYGILTGRYNWRTTLQSFIVMPYGDPLIAPERMTVAGLLREHGYGTACIGKWHLGMGWPFAADEATFFPPAPLEHELEATTEQQARWQAAFSQPTTGGPTTRGFDYYFGVDVPNWPPYCFIENDHTVGIPSEFLPERLCNYNLAAKGGPAMPYWHFEQLLPTWAKRTDQYIQQQAAAQHPFFLYLPMTSPHTPYSVNKPWIGKSGMNNLYADLVMETDDIFGQVMDSLERHGVAENTLVIFASDNGCARCVDLAQLAAHGHYPSAHYRGYKSDAWDGGHRIPCIMRWPGMIEPGSTSDQLVCLSDLMATCADIVGATLPDNAGEDSVSLMPLFQQPEQPVRELVVHHSGNGKFAMRDKQWKLLLCAASGGWTERDDDALQNGLPLIQLYDMTSDPSETNNVYAEHPAQVKAMLTQLKEMIDNGRSTPGAQQHNDVPIDLWKLDMSPEAVAHLLDDYSLADFA